jgi:SNF2 family DNA or RNA helicase
LIQITREHKAILISARDNKGKQVLSSPLHRIFLRSRLNGKLEQDSDSWIIPPGEKISDVLERIVRHFTKYNIQHELDEACQTILNSLERRRKDFIRLLKDGLNAKKRVSTTAIRNIRKILKPEFKRDLTVVQLHAVNHLLTVGNGANFSVPGSGKTSIALAYYHILRKKGDIHAILVIGPGSCFEPWEHEYTDCFQKKPKCVRLAGRPRAERHELYPVTDKYELLLTTYHGAARDSEQLIRLLRRRRYLVVLDESHYVKRPQGGKLAEAALTLAEYAQHRIILTGTPMPNGLPDLWSQFAFLWKDQLPLGTAEAYLLELQGKNSEEALEHVRRRVSPLFFRITKRQLGLPRPTFRIIKSDLSPLQARIYKGVAARFLSQIGEAPRDRDALREWRRARAIRLLQIAVNPSLLRRRCDAFQLPPMDLQDLPLSAGIDHYAKYELPNKIALACSLAKKLSEDGNKVIIWSMFVNNLLMVADLLKDLSPAVVHGGVPLSTTDADEISREHLISKFKNTSQCQVLIANPAACAESISLHKVCHHAIYLDRSFNCAHYLQSLDRIHRLGLGSDEKTHYYLILSSGTIDEVVQLRLKAKMEKMRKIVESDLPGTIPGYWTDDLGEEESIDFDLVENHIRELFPTSERQTR